ncbi:MAG TPA: tyrosine-type recombinase/integrase [Streptosporangiaceae bacterium]
MSELSRHLEDYLRLRRALGFKLEFPGFVLPSLVVTLLRLGLRASEAAALTLEDIDWRAGEFTVKGKGRRDERLPLPADVGEAIAAYLTRGRPVTVCREVFLREVAPAGPLGRGGISCIVRRACRRAGIPPIGAHRLRHTHVICTGFRKVPGRGLFRNVGDVRHVRQKIAPKRKGPGRDRAARGLRNGEYL